MFNDENGAMKDPFDLVYPELIEDGTVTYDDETLLIKLRNSQGGEITKGMADAGVAALEAIVPLEETTWYEAKLIDGTDAAECLAALRELKEVVLAEYNYEIRTAQIDSYQDFDDHHDYSGNDYHDKQWYMHHCGIPEGTNDMTTSGGSSSVVVAVIDSGVDYDHEDLSQNIWINDNEIPDNGMDDDGNGYVDDYYGVNIVTGSGNGDDDNGHGTHVAGIIAAQNNNLGIVGIAYNVKIMPVKAAMASGTLNQSDIAKAVLYAYEMGAEVINMSFGGSACSIAVQDALAVAYTRCVLVASAGNDGAPNENTDYYYALPNYPAALTYVLGVMSVDQNGVESNFTNWDANAFNGVEYELYAPGEAMISTLPNDQYGTLSGTSMAAPVVSAIAAILRSEFADRDQYPTKFIYGQLCSTSGYTATCYASEKHTVNGAPHELAQVVNLHDALTKLPKPEVNLQDYALFDTADIAEGNSGDGVIDAGEMIALGVTLRNRWGMSENTVVTVDTLSMIGIADPYVTIVNPSVNYGSVGTYSTQNAGAIYTDELLTGWDHPFYIQIAEDCPNDYRVKLNVTITCTNALDPGDTTVYESKGKIWLEVRSGVVLPSIIEEDMVLTPDNLYIIPNATVIEEGVTVRVEPGTHIQFWSDDPADPYGDSYIAYLLVKGNFLAEGTKEEPVYIYPSDLMDNYVIEISETDSGFVSLVWTEITNLCVGTNNTKNDNRISYAEHCTFRYNYGTRINYRYMYNGVVRTSSMNSPSMARFGIVKDSVFYKIGFSNGYVSIYGNAERCIFVDCGLQLDSAFSAKDCIFLGNDFVDQTVEEHGNSSLVMDKFDTLDPSDLTVKYNAETGTTYVLYYDGNSADRFSDEDMAAYIQEAFGGGYAVFETREELIRSGFEHDSFKAGIRRGSDGTYLWSDGTPISDDYLPMVVSDQDSYTKDYIQNGRLYHDYCYYSLFEIPGQVLVTDITFREYEVLMDLETTYQLAPLSAPLQYGVDQFLYECSDENVLTVDEKGLVTPVGIGTANVTVYSADRAVSNDVTIEVREYVPLESMTFARSDALLAVGDLLNVGCTLSPAETTRRNVTYTSSNEKVVTVDAGGNLLGIGSGTATITAQCEGLTATLTVNVYNRATSLQLSSVTMSVPLSDGTVELPNVIASAGAETVLTWRSTDPEVAAIKDGKLTLKKLGTTAIEVKDERSGLTASCLVIIEDGQHSGVKEIYAQEYYHYVLLENGSLYYWDHNEHTSVTLVATDVVEFAAYNYRVLTLSGNGELTIGDLGSASFSGYKLDYFAGKQVVGLEYAYTGYTSYFVWTKDGNAYAWGSSYTSGKLGVGTFSAVAEPTLIELENVVDIVSYSDSITYFLTDSGELYYAGGENQAATPTLMATNVAKIFDNSANTYFIQTLTTDGKWVQYRTDGTGSVFDSDISMWDSVAVYNSNSTGIGIKDGLVYTFSPSETPVPVPGIHNAVKVYTYNNTHYIATEDGLLFGIGNNSAAYNHFAGMTAANPVTTPVLIPMEPLVEEEIKLTGLGLLEENVLSDDSLVLTFNKALNSASARLYADGTQIVMKATIANTNHLVISRTSGFSEGVEYELVFDAGSITAAGGITNSEEIRIVFTYKASDSYETEDPEQTESDVVIHESRLDKTIERYITSNNLAAKLLALLEEKQLNPSFVGNAILNRISTDTDVTHWLRIQGSSYSGAKTPLGGNYWGTVNETAIGLQIIDYTDFVTYGRLMYKPYLTQAPENTFPFVTSVTILNEDGEEISVVGNETITVRVTFNRDMDTSVELRVRFGSAYPYGDYEISGEYVDARTWEGTYTLNTIIENGLQYWSISNGWSATEDLQLQPDTARFGFTIDTTAAQALLMQGYATETGIQLSWTQDDFDTLMGYNVYRATSEDGLYTRLNSTVIPADTMSFFDDTVEPGVVYYYNFTVVKTDLSESDTSGKISIMSMDTMAPDIYHTPVSTAKTGANLVISATVTDNLSIVYANVYYRVAGTQEWNKAVMNCLNSKHSAIIAAANITMDGLEYYIEAFDGVSFTYKGTAENPYFVTVYEAADAASLGDVDGNGAVTAYDALLLLYAINDKCNLTAEQFLRADLNGDGILSAAEALRILQYVTGTVGSLTMN